MSNVLSLPGRGNTYFYFTKAENGGFSGRQQQYIADLVRTYRTRFPKLEITGVWDFGMEEGKPWENEKYGVFADCPDLAVFNVDMYSISFNHVRVSKMSEDLSGAELSAIERRYCLVRRISRMAGQTREELMNRGTPPGQILKEIRRKADLLMEEDPEFREQNAREAAAAGERESGEGTAAAGWGDAGPGLQAAEGKKSGGDVIAPGPHNHLPLEDPLFADVWAVRQLEQSMSIRRLTVHEIGHAISETYDILRDKKVKKLFARCRDGFEDLDEFCAECFMASEFTKKIALANELAEIFRERCTGAARPGRAR